VPHPKVKLSDDSGNEVGVTSNRLDVNAYLSATPTIDIGDVSLLLGGTAASTNAGTMDAQTLRVTLATDDTHFGEVGAGTAASATGPIHGQLRYIANSVGNIQGEIDSQGSAIDNIVSQTALMLKTLGTTTYTEASSFGNAIAAVRNDTLDALADTDNEFAPFQVNDIGALYVTGESKQQTAVTDYGFSIMGEAKSIDGSTLPNSVSEGNSARLAMSRAGIAYTCLTDDVGASDLGTTITTHLSEIEGAVETIEGAIDGSEMQVDIVSSATLSVNSHAVTNAGTFAVQSTLQANSGVDIGDVDVTSMPSDTFVAEGGALGKGVLLQGDDGTDRHNIQCDSNGMLEVRLYTGSTGGVTSAFKADKDSYNEGAIGISAKAKRSDALANLTNVADGDWTSLQVNAEGALYTTHGITGMVSDLNNDIGTSAEKIHAAADVAIKRIDIIAQSTNTSVIYVGDSGVAGNGSGGGIRLNPGDFYSLDIDNTADIYVAANVDGEDVHYIYYT